VGILDVLAGRASDAAPMPPDRLTATTARDQHGQPLNRAFRSEQVIDRQIDELIGIAKGVIADGHLCKPEAEFLVQWMETNRAASGLWPATVLYPRLTAVLADGRFDGDEEAELLELLLHTVGGNAPAHGEASMSTELPFTKPPPTIDFVDRAFCFTGKFFSGTRSWCEEQVASRGAHCCAITRDLDYLVIGEIGSRDWIHSTHGRKIEKAIEDNGRGCCIGIVSEQYWHGFL
jgi:NAD-dependent DNA ligase